MRSMFKCLALLFAFAIPAMAHADSFTYTDGTDITTWNIASGSAADASIPGLFASFTDVQVTHDGVISSETVDFFNPAIFSGVDLGGSQGYQGAFGQKLYTGPESAPVFLYGTFSVLDSNGQAATVSITPEPSSLALLGTGLLGAFGVARRRFKA